MSAAVAAAVAATLTAPPIGQYWPGQGGINAGLSRGVDGAPDAYLIVAADTSPALTWDKALEHAKAYTADGLTDFRAPTRAELALCYAHLKAEFCEVWAGYYWTCEQYSASSAWVQYFDYGNQGHGLKDFQRRVRPVRRFIPQSFNASTALATSDAVEVEAVPA